MLGLANLQQLIKSHTDLLDLKVREFSIAGHKLPFNQSPSIMGVINLSPDSWYRESVCLGVKAAVQRGKRLVADGADLVDIGAESTLLSGSKVGIQQQKERLLPVIRDLAAQKILVSVETYHPKVAEACLDAGANVLNLTGTEHTRDIFQMAAERKAAVILCYVEGKNVRKVSRMNLREDMIPVMEAYFERKIEEANRAGLNRIIIDPGLGFYYHNLKDSSVRIRHQMRVFLNTFRLRRLGWPICHALPHAFECFEDEVRSAEPFFAVLALLGQTNLLRTHEVSRVQGVCRALSLWQ